MLFGVGGGLAFLVDAGVLHLLARRWGVDPYGARLGSFMCAVTATWLFNRTFTFGAYQHKQTLLHEWTRYVVSQLGGFAVNYAVYAALVWSLALVHHWPVLGVAAGSAAGLTVNYLLARRYVFDRQKGEGSVDV